jgi:16S rRNA (cytidine1402-2'-O)-methyltransferase
MSEISSKGRLFLIPTPLAPYSLQNWEPQRILGMIAPAILERLYCISFYVVESEKSASRLLSRILPAGKFAQVSFLPLDEHSTDHDLEAPLAALKAGNDCAILSEAGLPCIADPGAALVEAAHRENIRVIPWGSDSSLLMALAASGLNGQEFSFLGYLPVHDEELRKKLTFEGAAALRDGAARIFIETPYRNAKMIESCKGFLPEKLHLCFASELGTELPTILSMPVSLWKKYDFVSPDQPAVFCFGLPARLTERASLKRRSPAQPARKERRSFR